MTTPFDALAACYSGLWSETSDGIAQRRQVWREIDGIFISGQSILDLGCGTGDDALHLQSRGLRVTGIDASGEMIAAAQQRGVDAHQLTIEELKTLTGSFDGALSNFAAFNCLADPSVVARDLAQRLRPHAYFAMCVFGRFYWREVLRYALALDFSNATRRWTGHTTWRGIRIYYRTARDWSRAFAPHFTLMRRTAIGGGDHELYIWRRT